MAEADNFNGFLWYSFGSVASVTLSSASKLFLLLTDEHKFGLERFDTRGAPSAQPRTEQKTKKNTPPKRNARRAAEQAGDMYYVAPALSINVKCTGK